MRILGINALNHDASVAVFQDTELTFHGRSGNEYLNEDLLDNALGSTQPDLIAWYERPWLKKSRQLFAGQFRDALDTRTIPSVYLKRFNLDRIPIRYVPHHLSHAAGAIYQSSFKSTAIIVADAIGEWETVSVWNYNGNFKKLYSRSYPYSLGLFYSAFTELVGLIPTKDENKFMELSKNGCWENQYSRVRPYLTRNLHKGIWDWDVQENEKADIASAVQKIFEEQLQQFLNIARINNNNIIFTGGCAYNKLSHKLLAKTFKAFSIPKYPGDAGSSIGAAYYISQLNISCLKNFY
jgi:carbamoyltransferase